MYQKSSKNTLKRKTKSIEDQSDRIICRGILRVHFQCFLFSFSQHYVVLLVRDVNSIFETSNLKGRRGSRERKESAALRRECWRVLDLFSGLAKSLPERNLWIPWAARLPPTLTRNWLPCLLFFVFFLDRFLEGLFSIFGDFRPSLGTPKIIKNH